METAAVVELEVSLQTGLQLPTVDVGLQVNIPQRPLDLGDGTIPRRIDYLDAAHKRGVANPGRVP